MMFGNYGWGMGFGAFGMLLFWGLLIIGVVALVRWMADGARGRDRPYETKSPLDLLAERYARGEIDRAEYLEKRADLTGKAETPGP